MLTKNMAKNSRRLANTSIPVVYIFSLLFLASVVWGAVWTPMERACLCKEFRCSNGTFCLHAERVCNGFKDCPDGEDEQQPDVNGKCQRKKANCSPDEFKCKFGDCIKLTAVCDGKIDCWGAVDEAIDFCTWLYSDDSNTTSPL